jgi:hypothetical protein
MRIDIHPAHRVLYQHGVRRLVLAIRAMTVMMLVRR